ncbi:MAG: hypothetical protein C4293_06010 [Nitrospiraceae bacterium]
MAKKTPLETDIARLKEKVRTKAASTDNPEGDASLRSLRKRLKRAQRKRQRKNCMRKTNQPQETRHGSSFDLACSCHRGSFTKGKEGNKGSY